MPIQIELGIVTISLQTCQGSMDFNDFVNFNIAFVDKTFALTICDPRQCHEDLVTLSHIHEIIQSNTEHLNEDEKARASYWLASLFHFYFDRYELYKEGWGCRKAWVHLLRLRYHAMFDILRQKDGALSDDERYHFRLALRDWRDFCVDESNHFMLHAGQKLDPVEEEVKHILYGKSKPAKQPLSFFLEPDGERVLDRLIDDWFLRDRYDWLRAIKLTWQSKTNWFRKSKKRKWFGYIILVSIIPIFLGFFPYIGARSFDGVFGAILLPAYILVSGLAIVSLFCRAIADIFLPRLLASILVGYLPLMLTSELWEMSAKFNNPWSFVGFNALAFFISFLYLRWEIGNKLARTPKLCLRIPIGRALLIIGYGFVGSFLIGLIILDLVGCPLMHTFFDKASLPTMHPGIFGEIYWKGLWLFFPFALLIGVIVQVFWEEKSITHPLE